MVLLICDGVHKEHINDKEQIEKIYSTNLLESTYRKDIQIVLRCYRSNKEKTFKLTFLVNYKPLIIEMDTTVKHLG